MAQPTSKTTRRIRSVVTTTSAENAFALPNSRQSHPLVNDEAAWFDPSSADAPQAAMIEKCREYIRSRFSSSLLPEDIDRLLENEKMLQIVVRHCQEFRKAANAGSSSRTGSQNTTAGTNSNAANQRQREPQGNLINLPANKNRAA